MHCDAKSAENTKSVLIDALTRLKQMHWDAKTAKNAKSVLTDAVTRV